MSEGRLRIPIQLVLLDLAGSVLLTIGVLFVIGFFPDNLPRLGFGVPLIIGGLALHAPLVMWVVNDRRTRAGGGRR